MLRWVGEGGTSRGVSQCLLTGQRPGSHSVCSSYSSAISVMPRVLKAMGLSLRKNGSFSHFIIISLHLSITSVVLEQMKRFISVYP